MKKDFFNFLFLFLLVLPVVSSYGRLVNISIPIMDMSWYNTNVPNKTIVYDATGGEWELNVSTQQGTWHIFDTTYLNESVIRFYRNSDVYDGAYFRLINRDNTFRLEDSSKMFLNVSHFNYVLTSSLESKRELGLYNTQGSSVFQVFSWYPTSAYNNYGVNCVLGSYPIAKNVSQIVAYKSSCTLFNNRYNEFNTIRFKFWGDHEGSNQQNATIYEIKLLNVVNTSYENTLPYLYDEIDYQGCYNESKEENIVSLYYSVIDDESDDIYYLKNFDGYYDYNKSIKYYKNFLLPFIQEKDYSFLTTSRFGSPYCKFEYDDYNASSFGIVNYPIKTSSSSRDNTYLFYLPYTTSCRPEYIQELNPVLDNLEYTTSIYGLDENTAYFNLSFYNQVYEPVLRLKFLSDGTNISIYSHNGTAFNKAGETEVRSSTHALKFTLLKMSDSSDPYIRLYDDFGDYDSQLYYLDKINDDFVSYIGISNYYGFIYQNGFSYGGTTATWNYTLDRPNNISITGVGSFDFTLKVTDLYHLNDSSDYNEYTKDIFVHSCKDVSYINGTMSYGNDEYNVTSSDELKPYEIGKTLVGSNFVDYLNSLGNNSYKKGQNIIWILWLFLFFGLVFMQWKSGGVDIGYPLFISSLTISIITYILDYDAEFLASLVLMAFPLAVIVMRALSDQNVSIGTTYSKTNNYSKPVARDVRRR